MTKATNMVSRKVFDAMQEDRDYWKDRASQEKRERQRIQDELAFERQAQHRRARDQAWAH